LCSWHLEHTDLKVAAVTTFEGTALCASCNSRAYAEAEDAADEGGAAFDKLQEAAERQAASMLTWLRARTPGSTGHGSEESSGAEEPSAAEEPEPSS
jgi:hypothetical protein